MILLSFFGFEYILMENPVLNNRKKTVDHKYSLSLSCHYIQRLVCRHNVHRRLSAFLHFRIARA